MAKLTLLVGPPGSGKSTLARDRILNDGDHGLATVYVNQDLDGKEHLTIFNTAIAQQKDVIVDRMNFNRIQRDRYLVPAKTNGYETEIIVLHEPYDRCLKRCIDRKNHLTIKDEISAKAALATFFGKYERVQDSEADKVIRIWPESHKPSAIIADLDGTLCNTDARQHFVRKPPGDKKDWKSFFDGIPNDPVNKWCADIIRSMSGSHTIVYCSGRSEDYRKDTVDWLMKNALYYINDHPQSYYIDQSPHLYMRSYNDSRQDNIVKEIILDFEILTRFTPYFMIDDRQQVVDMYRNRGFTVLQCAKGDF